MEKYDEELVSQLMEKDAELKRQVDEHRTLEDQLEVFEKKPYLTTEEETEVKRLKKLKLRAKDRIEAVLAGYRKHHVR